MRTTTAALGALLAVGLLVGSTTGAAAQEDATFLTWTAAPGESEGTGTIEATDPLAGGTLTIGIGGALVTDDATVGTASARLANDGGAWTGPIRTFVGDGDATTVDIWELTGDGAYAGLSLFLFDYAGNDQPWGLIVRSDAIPPVPEVPAG